jgi:hypothetical protein
MKSCDFLKFITSSKVGHCYYVPRAPKNLATVLEGGKLRRSLRSYFHPRIMSLSWVIISYLAFCYRMPETVLSWGERPSLTPTQNKMYDYNLGLDKRRENGRPLTER